MGIEWTFHGISVGFHGNLNGLIAECGIWGATFSYILEPQHVFPAQILWLVSSSWYFVPCKWGYDVTSNVQIQTKCSGIAGIASISSASQELCRVVSETLSVCQRGDWILGIK